MDFILY